MSIIGSERKIRAFYSITHTSSFLPSQDTIQRMFFTMHLLMHRLCVYLLGAYSVTTSALAVVPNFSAGTLESLVVAPINYRSVTVDAWPGLPVQLLVPSSIDAQLLKTQSLNDVYSTTLQQSIPYLLRQLEVIRPRSMTLLQEAFHSSTMLSSTPLAHTQPMVYFQKEVCGMPSRTSLAPSSTSSKI